MKRFATALAATLTLTGCASTVTVRPIAREAIDAVCIERNPDVGVDDLLPALEGAFRRNGISSKVFDVTPAPCPYRVTYTASRRWDFTAFMSDAHVFMWRDRELIGEAVYEGPSGIFGGGGINPDKWRGAAFKLDPPMDRMLAAVRK